MLKDSLLQSACLLKKAKEKKGRERESKKKGLVIIFNIVIICASYYTHYSKLILAWYSRNLGVILQPIFILQIYLFMTQKIQFSRSTIHKSEAFLH